MKSAGDAFRKICRNCAFGIQKKEIVGLQLCRIQFPGWDPEGGKLSGECRGAGMPDGSCFFRPGFIEMFQKSGKKIQRRRFCFRPSGEIQLGEENHGVFLPELQQRRILQIESSLIERTEVADSRFFH